MIDLDAYPRAALELFIVRGKVVATQQSYSTLPNDKSEPVEHFYCPHCGEVWGERITPNLPVSYHHYFSEPCKDCGGKEEMIHPMEWNNLDFLGGEVLAYLFLKETEGYETEIIEV